MTYQFQLEVVLPATPQQIYDCWLSSEGHTNMTGGAATISDQIGLPYSAWDEYISGVNLELNKGKRIKQSWRTTEFSPDHQDSIIAIELTEVESGTLLVLTHSNVPIDQKSYENNGWQDHYFTPMLNYFSQQESENNNA